MDEDTWDNNCFALTVVDSSGNSKHGQSCPAGSGSTGGASGKIGAAGTFDGKQFVQIPGSSDYTALPSFTLAFWTQLDNLNPNDHIFYDGLSSNAGHIWFAHRSNVGLEFEFRPVAGAQVKVVGQTAPTMKASTWYHVALVRNGSQWTIYLDAVAVASATFAGSVVTGSNIIIGYGADSAFYLKGRLDDYRIYNRALSLSEIAALAK
jgi:hypothetical protein